MRMPCVVIMGMALLAVAAALPRRAAAQCSGTCQPCEPNGHEFSTLEDNTHYGGETHGCGGASECECNPGPHCECGGFVSYRDQVEAVLDDADLLFVHHRASGIDLARVVFANDDRLFLNRQRRSIQMRGTCSAQPIIALHLRLSAAQLAACEREMAILGGVQAGG